MNLTRIKNLLLSLNHARKAVGIGFFAEAVKSNLKLEIMDSVPARKVLVLSPHPDDDIFGSGGTLKLLADTGSEIRAVYLANGSSGNKSGKSDDGGTVKIRQQETEEGAKLIGIKSLSFWDYEDGKLETNKDTVSKLKAEMQKFQPEIIFSPTLLDPHPDHSETVKLLAETLKEIEFRGEIFQYEVWQPVFANRLVKIDKTIETKKSAILAHKSQLDCRAYLEAIMGLNQYRAGMFNAGGFAEAFFASNKKIYLELAKQTKTI